MPAELDKNASKIVDIYDKDYDHAGVAARLPEGAGKMKALLGRLARINADPHWFDDGKLLDLFELMRVESEAFEELKTLRSSGISNFQKPL